jgi:hypothetical protein
MKKCLFTWLLVCLVVPKGFSQTVDYSGVYKATLTCWGFKIAGQDLILKKSTNNAYTGFIQAHVVNTNSMIKVGGVDTNLYALDELIVARGVVSYKVDQMKTKPAFTGKISKDDKSIDGKWIDQTTRTSLHYVKVASEIWPRSSTLTPPGEIRR